MKKLNTYRDGDQHYAVIDQRWFDAIQKTDGAIALAVIEKRITPIATLANR